MGLPVPHLAKTERYRASVKRRSVISTRQSSFPQVFGQGGQHLEEEAPPKIYGAPEDGSRQGSTWLDGVWEAAQMPEMLRSCTPTNKLHWVLTRSSHSFTGTYLHRARGLCSEYADKGVWLWAFQRFFVFFFLREEATHHCQGSDRAEA